MNGEWLSVRQVMDRLGLDRKSTVDYLGQLHERHGDLLFRKRGRRTKWRISASRWREIMAIRDGDGPAKAPTPADIERLHGRVDRNEELVERALRQIGDLWREVRG